MRRSVSMTRRTLLGAGACAAVSAGAHGASWPSGEIASGFVAEMRDGASHGVKGILVSNGVDIVMTDEEGRYRLPIRDGVFLIKPAHWSLPLNLRTGTPAFAYNHRPAGSPRLRYGGLAATGALPASLDFIIQRSPEPKSFSAVMFADPQPENERELEYLRCAMDKMSAGHNFAFALGLGDIAADNLAIYDGYQHQTARLGVPVWHIPGNHDHDYDAIDNRFRLDTWRQRFGAPTYAFEFSGVMFVMLDNVRTRPDGSYFGAIGRDGLAFVSNLLAFTPRDRLIVVCTHIPLTSSLKHDPSCATADAGDLMRLLEGRRSVSFAGHMHTSEHHYLPVGGGLHHHQIIAALSGSWWSGPYDAEGRPLAIASDGTPNGWHVLTIDGVDFQTTFEAARNDNVARAIIGAGSPEMRSGGPVELIAITPADFSLMINVYDGGPNTSVHLDLNGTRHALRRVHEADPYVEALFRDGGDAVKYWVRPEASSHLWALDGPQLSLNALASARLTIVDEFGRARLQQAELFRA